MSLICKQQILAALGYRPSEIIIARRREHVTISNWLEHQGTKGRKERKKGTGEATRFDFPPFRWRAVHEDPVTFRLTSSVKLENKRAASWCSQLATEVRGNVKDSRRHNSPISRLSLREIISQVERTRRPRDEEVFSRHVGRWTRERKIRSLGRASGVRVYRDAREIPRKLTLPPR